MISKPTGAYWKTKNGPLCPKPAIKYQLLEGVLNYDRGGVWLITDQDFFPPPDKKSFRAGPQGM